MESQHLQPLLTEADLFSYDYLTFVFNFTSTGGGGMEVRDN